MVEPFVIAALPSMKMVPFTVRTFVDEFHESSPFVFWHVYELDGVRLISPALSFLYVSLVASLSLAAATGLSNVGGVPLTVWHG